MLQDKIQQAYQDVKSYPELAKKLAEVGVQSYTVDVATSIILYRFVDGENYLQQNGNDPKSIELDFDKEATIKAIRDNQQKKTDFPTFMNYIAKAGVRFYEATLNGNNKRVTYIGKGGYYDESIPF